MIPEIDSDTDHLDVVGGAPEKDGSRSYYLERFTLEDYPWDEVWLRFNHSHTWEADNEILIPVE